MSKSPTTTTLAADGSTPAHKVQGTLVQLQLSGTFGGGSVAAEILAADGSTWIPLADDSNTAIALTVAQAKNIEVPPDTEVRATLSGATSPDLLISIKEISDARSG